MGFSEREVSNRVYVNSNYIKYITKIITVATEGKRLPLPLVWQFPKSGLHHWPELPQTLVTLQINRPPLQVQNEGADYHYNDGPHGCEVI